MRKCENLPKNLFVALSEEWHSIGGETLENLVDSMPHHIKAVINARGNPTLIDLSDRAEFNRQNIVNIFC